MANAKNVIVLLVGMALCAVSAQAQAPGPATEKAFANVNFGGQLATRTITSTLTQSIYSETATLVSSQPVSRGLVFDFGGGYRVWGDFFAGLLVSWYGDSETASTSASIPDPIFFNRPRTVAGTQTGLKRREMTVSPHAIWATPLTDNFDLSVAAGLAIIHVSQDLVNVFGVPTGTQNVTTGTTKQKGTAVGPYVGVDFTYNLKPLHGFKPLYGVGGYLRYAGGKVDLPSVADAKAGGLQIGGGVRLRFADWKVWK